MADGSMVERLAEKWGKWTRSGGMEASDEDDVRFMLNATADELESEANTRGPGKFGGHYLTTVEWLRAQASTGESDD